MISEVPPEPPLPRPSLLGVIEAIAVLAWLVLAGVMVLDKRTQHMVPIDVAALAGGESTEAWMGVYFEEHKVGYAMHSETVLPDGRLLLQSRSAFEVAAFGELKKVVTIWDAVVGADGVVQRFDFFMDSDPVRITGQGEITPTEIRMEILQAGEVSELRIPIDEPPQMSISLASWVRSLGGELQVGDRHVVPYFDPITMTRQDMEIRVMEIEVLPTGEEAFWIKRSLGEVETRALMTPVGDVLREEGALGLAMVRQTPEEAQRMPDGVQAVNLIELSAVRLTGGVLDQPRMARVVVMDIEGVEARRIHHGPPYQSVSGDRVTVSMPLWAEVPGDLPVQESAPDLAEYLQATPFLPVNHREIQDTAADVVGDATDRKHAVELLTDWVFGYLHKAPTMGVPNALEVLRVQQGDCNEHTSLFVALARASGIPARIAAGVVYSDALGDRGGFYYHAWPEVHLGSAGWVPVDPTFGQFPADATHVKLVEGDLDKQVEIMGVLGRLGFELVESR